MVIFLKAFPHKDKKFMNKREKPQIFLIKELNFGTTGQLFNQSIKKVVK